MTGCCVTRCDHHDGIEGVHREVGNRLLLNVKPSITHPINGDKEASCTEAHQHRVTIPCIGRPVNSQDNPTSSTQDQGGRNEYPIQMCYGLSLIHISEPT